MSDIDENLGNLDDCWVTQANDQFQCIVEDNLTALSFFKIVMQGHVVRE